MNRNEASLNVIFNSSTDEYFKKIYRNKVEKQKEDESMGNISSSAIKSDMAIRQLEDEFKRGLLTKKEVVAILTRENGWRADDAQYMADIYEKMYY